MFNDCILFNSKKLERKLTNIAEQEFEKIGLHHTYAYILTVIDRCGYTKVKVISVELCLDSSTVTRMVNKLENEGLVQRGSENSKVEISLTSKGQELIPAISEAWKSYHTRMDDLLGRTQATSLLQVLTEVNEQINTK